MGRRKNGEGSMSTKPDKNGIYHCYMQTKVINNSGNYVRVHGQGRTQEEASKDAKKKNVETITLDLMLEKILIEPTAEIKKFLIVPKKIMT